MARTRQRQSPTPPGGSNVGATVSATLKGSLRGFEQLTLILGTLLVVLVAFLMWLAVAYANQLPLIIAIPACLLLCFLTWKAVDRHHDEHPEGPITTVNSGPTDISISGPFKNPVDALRVVAELRRAIQNRELLPPPHGAVEDQQPQNDVNLKEYTPGEREQVAKSMLAATRSHDERIAEGLNRIEHDAGMMLTGETESASGKASPPMG